MSFHYYFLIFKLISKQLFAHFFNYKQKKIHKLFQVTNELFILKLSSFKKKKNLDIKLKSSINTKYLLKDQNE